MNVIDVLLAKLRESIVQAIPHIITLLSHREWNIRQKGANALLKLSKQCKALKSKCC